MPEPRPRSVAVTRRGRRSRRRDGPSPAGRFYRWVLVSGRWFVVVAWIAAAVAVNVLVTAAGGGGDDFGDLLSEDSAPIRVERQVLQQFEVPLLSGTTVVVHQQGGISTLTRADVALFALSATKAAQAPDAPSGPDHVLAAIPVPTSDPTNAVTYLYFSDGTGRPTQVRLARQYAEHFSNQASVRTYVTGFVPAQRAQSTYLRSRLTLFELASVVLIFIVVALAFRSPLAPLAVLAVAAVGYLVYFPLLNTLASALGFAVPSQLEPVLVALLLGIATDYCVLFFDAFRDELENGLSRHAAARAAVASTAPIVAVAGLTVAGGTLSLTAAPFGIFRALGPALALTVAVGLAVCLTLTPALMTLLGRRLFQVSPIARDSATARRPHPRNAHRLIRLLTVRPVAALMLVVVLGAMVLAAAPVRGARLDLSFTSALPDDDPVARGAQLLGDSGLRGITAPTEVLLTAPGIGTDRLALARLQGAIEQEPGVALVLGPASSPLQTGRGIVLSRDGNAARYVIAYNSDPLAAQAIDDVRTLQDRLPALVRQAGLGQAQVAATGQTTIASAVARLTRASLEITIAVALVVELVILAVYLRALVAPVALLLASALSVAASLGLTTLLFQDVLGQAGLTFYAPFAAAVLLLALGADYTVFSVGSIWEQARTMDLRSALRDAVPRSNRAITTAGIILSLTFAMVAIIPLSTFRQIAFAVSFGLLLDTLVVRPVVTPATLVLLGRVAGWPSRRIHTTHGSGGGEPGHATEVVAGPRSGAPDTPRTPDPAVRSVEQGGTP